MTLWNLNPLRTIDWQPWLAAACLAIVASCTSGGASHQAAVPFTIGGENYPFGDRVEIESVQSDTGAYEVGSTLTVRGRYRLASRPTASLYLGVTALGDGVEKLPKPEVDLSRVDLDAGEGEFVLEALLRSEGHPHVTFYDHGTGKPFGGVYFGSGRWLETDTPEHYAR